MSGWFIDSAGDRPSRAAQALVRLPEACPCSVVLLGGMVERGVHLIESRAQRNRCRWRAPSVSARSGRQASLMTRSKRLTACNLGAHPPHFLGQYPLYLELIETG